MTYPATTDDHRLPTTVIPRRYELEITPDLDAAVFEGSVTIEVELTEPTDTIVLHAVELDITTAWVRREGGAVIEAAVHLDAEHEWIRLELAGQTGPGDAEVHLDFAGRFNEHLVGFYLSTFNRGDTEHRVAVTQFESTHARRAFPCFDEPAFKAVFGVTLVVPNDLMAVSNAAEIGREPAGEDRTRVRFADTIVMSTYLVAFVVGPLEATETVDVAGLDGPIPLRVVHLPGQGPLCRFALEVAEAALKYFEQYYDLAYPGDKVDLVAVPDFAFGAMENLGCVVFREVLLVVDPATATPQELQRVADVINHELAHMWFGDLVTMKWWNGIWLNEAFATFMELMASDAFRPDWQVWTTFGLSRSAAFDTDALHATRPIEFEVVTAEEAEAMFDVLTYEKGCSVVRMLEQYLGPEVFREGIRAYLRRHAFANTDTTDLWDILEETSGEPVRRIMDAWILRGGHPLVKAHVTPTGVELSQQRATFLPTRQDEQERWPVPLVVQVETTDGAARSERILLQDQATLELGAPARLLQADGGGNGFFRTLLPGDLRRALAEQGGTPLERFALLDDTWFAVVSGAAGLDAVREVIEILSAREDEASVWRRIASVCDGVQRLLGPANEVEVAGWVRDLLEVPRTCFVFGASPSGQPAEIAAIIFELAGDVGRDGDAIREARAVFDTATSDPAVAAAALLLTARHADAATYAEIRRRWQDSATPQEEQRHLAALVATDDPALFVQSLELAGTEVRAQDAPYLLRRALEHPELGGFAWEWVAEHWADVTGRLPSSGLPRMLAGIRGFTDEDLAASVEAFLADHPLAVGGLQVNQHLERMRATVLAAQRLRG